MGDSLPRSAYLLGTAIDGQAGANTRRAVTTFQKTKNLAADGVAGPQTWQALLC
ncbi:peptidoglycan-binding domain-containing protein [Amycolatopsis sp. NPDC004625]|uniref:peptidoglycan-binding domain-containing protein n=1 Tax=Amycolatopsis sp. NPDC004625 TaxID=3154670 RepID=UPI0033BED0AD